MGHGLGPFQREVLQRIGKHIEMFGDAKVADIAKEMALAGGLVALVLNGIGTEHELDVAHAIGLRHALAMLGRRESSLRAAPSLDECALETKEETAADCHALD